MRDESSDNLEESSKTWRSPESDLRALETILRRTGNGLQKPVLTEGALWFGAAALAVVLSGLLLAALLPQGGYAVGRWVMGIGLGSATLGAVVALGLYLWRKPQPDQIASRIQRHSPEFRSDLAAALEFGRALAEDGGETLRESGFSEAMARAHLSKTVRRVYEESKNNSLAHLVPKRDLTPPILAFSGGLALMLVPFVINFGWTLGMLSGERMGAPVVGERVVEDTVVGYMDGIFVYPSYTGLDRQMMRLGSGYIESLEGTEVHLRATLMPGQWESLEMVLELGDEEEPQVIEMVRDEGNQASVSLVLGESGSYWFRARTVEGRPVEDRTERRIRVARDEAPRVRVHSHEGRVEVQPEDYVEFDFEISDDFGVDAVTMVYHFIGAEDDEKRERLELSELSRQPRNVEGVASLDLQPLHLQPKDGVVVYFEARDNNTATGPGIGKSEPIVLYVESPEDKHMENIAAQQELMIALLLHLGDFLEAPVGTRELQDDGTYRQRVDAELSQTEQNERYHTTRRLHRNREPLLDEMDELIEVLRDDPLMVSRNLTLFDGLAKQLRDLQDNGDELFSVLDSRTERNDLTTRHLQELADYAADSERKLEKGILSLEELLVSQKMDLVKATAEDIEGLRQRLRELLEQYRDTQDPELKEAIQREIQRLRQRMNELMQRMQMQLEEMPREHINLEAMEQMEMESQTRDMADQLRSIEEMLENDDIDGALAALDEMEMSLDSLTNEMDDSFSSMEPQGLSELDQAVAEMMDEVTQLQEIEEHIEEQTRELQEDLRRERQEMLDEMLEPLTDELMEAIEAQQRGLDQMEERELPRRDRGALDHSKGRMNSLQEMVEQQDLEQALERARQAQNSLRSLRGTLNLSERYVREDTEQGRDVRRSRAESEEMVQRADQIAEALEEFMNQAQQDLQPGEEQRFEELAEQQAQSRERAQQLRERLDQEGQRYPALEQELRPSMEAAEEAMGQAEQELRERRVQQALDQERQAIEQLNQLGESMSQALEKQRQQDRQQSGRERQQDQVEIPGEDSGEARERLRREMMEGMREGRIDDYDSQIERYFRSLVE